MKRGLRIATGIVVLLALVFGTGVLSGERAYADGIQDKPPQEEKFTLPITKWPDPATGQPRTSYMSTKDIFVESNTTYSRKEPYDANIWVDPGVTLTIGTNANVVINGDLIIGGTVVMSSGTLTVNGDIDNFGSLTIKGTAKLIVNKAPVLNSGRYGGNIVTSDALELGAIITVSGSATVTVNPATNGGFFVQDEARIKMDSASAKITVYNRCYFGGASTSASLTAGTLEVVNGNFRQAADSSDYSFCAGPNFVVSMKGTSSTSRTVYFDTPARSHINRFTTSGMTFTNSSWISLERELTADWSLNVNNANVYFQGDLASHKFTVTAKSFCPTDGGEVILTQGTLTINGALVLDEKSRLHIGASMEKVIVNGSVYFDSSFPSFFTNGTLEVNGDFYQMTRDMQPSESFIVRMKGANRLVQFGNIATSYFTNFELAQGASLNASSTISINKNLTANTTYNYPNLYYRGNLNGYSLTATNLTVPAGNTLTVGDGTLTVNGDLTVAGDLVMTEAADKVIVTGNYTASSASASTDLSDGKLYLAGNFAQSGNAASFLATGSHTTILNGTGAQTVTFGSTNSRFASLVILNDSLDPATIPNQYDSITLSGTTMKGITASAGTMTPGFDAAEREYVVLLPNGTSSVIITPEFLDRYAGSAWMTQDDGTVPVTAVTVDAVPYNGSKTVTVKAHAYNDVAISTYTFKVMTINPDLAGLGTLPTGAVAEPAFDPSVHSYTVQLPESVSSFTFAPQADHPDSTVHIDADDGPASVTVAPAPGESVTKTVGVIAQDGTTKGTYTVIFTRRNPLTGIKAADATDDTKLFALSPAAFSAGTTSYTVKVPTNVPSVTVTALKADTDPDWSKFEITADGSTVEADHVDVALAVGESKTVTIKAYDKDGKTSATYSVALTRVAMLSGITLSAGTLTPSFDAGVANYSVNVPSTTTSVKVTPVKTPACTSMKINGVAASYVTLSLAPGGKSTATIECTNGTGTEAFTWTYTVDVYRVAPITGIAITGGTLSPAFATTTTAYTVSVPATTASVTVKPAVSAYCSDMKMGGQSVASVVLTPAIGSSASTQITGTGLDGKVYSYTVTVKRAALITGITPSPGTLSPAFKTTTLGYTVTVPYTTTQVKITPVKASTGVKYLYINGKAATYAYIKPPLGGSANAVIKAVAADGKTSVTYTVTVKRTGLISGINLSGGAKLTPAFVGSTAAYTVHLPVTTSSVTITPAKTSYCKSFTIDGRAVASKVITPPAGGSATCTIVATALNGTTKSTYTVKVVSNRPITGIGLSSGKLTPAFSATRLTYDVTISGDTPSVKITPTRTTGFNYTINGGAVNTPATISVAPNDTETATIVATYPGGSITYTVNVHRNGLLTDIDAEDDDGESIPLTFITTDSSYDLDVPADVDGVTITPAAVPGATLTIDGESVASKVYSPAIGGSATATILVDCSGEQMTYTVTIHRAEAPNNIVAISGALDPVFSNDVFDYEIHLDHATGPDTASLNVTATGDCIIQTSGLTATKPASPGYKVATITLTPAGDFTVTYTIKIYWD